MLALWILLVLGATSLHVLGEVRSRMDLASLARARTVARYAAESGVVDAQALLEGIVRAAESPGDQARVFDELRDRTQAWGQRGMGSARYQVAVEDLGARVDLNRASEPVLLGLLRQFVPEARAEELVRALRGAPGSEDEEWSGEPETVEPGNVGPTEPARGFLMQAGRPLSRLEELSRVPGFDDSITAAIAPYVTVRGDGLINVNTASRTVLASVPAIGDRAARSLILAREGRGAFPSSVALHSELSQASAGPVDSRLPDLTTVTRRILVISRGWEEGHPSTHEIQAVFDVLASRLVTGPRVRLRLWVERER